MVFMFVKKTYAGHSAENLAIILRIAYNLMKQDNKKISMKGKRLNAGWNNDYLKKLLSQLFKF